MKVPDFDRIASLYRWLEYATLGRVLEQTREHHLGALAGARRALVLGDGDGRFTQRMLALYPDLMVHAVDASACMLALLRARSASPRLRTSCRDARTIPSEAADLIVTHFFLDCLHQPDVEALIGCHAPHANLWLTSEFHAPPGLLYWPARAYIRALYFIFRVLTGLRVTRVPDYRKPLLHAGMLPTDQFLLGGILVTTLWRRIQPAMPADQKEEDALPDPEPIAPSLDEPDAAVYHPKQDDAGEG